MTSKTQCDFCGRLIPWGEDFFWLNAVFTADSHPEHPGHKLGWDICQECFVTKLPKYSPLDKNLSTINRDISNAWGIKKSEGPLAKLLERYL